MIIAEIDSFSQFQSVFEDHKEDSVLFALFQGTKDSTTGASWCSDCSASEPIIRRVVDRIGIERNLLICCVGLRNEWKERPDNPYRTSPNARVRCIPTLIRYRNGKEMARLEEGQLLNEVAVETLFSD